MKTIEISGRPALQEQIVIMPDTSNSSNEKPSRMFINEKIFESP